MEVRVGAKGANKNGCGMERVAERGTGTNHYVGNKDMLGENLDPKLFLIL